MSRRILMQALVLICALLPGRIAAQNRGQPRDTTSTPRETFAPQDTVAAALTSRRITPGRAFVRSLLIPGWGQFSQGAAKRGAVYVGLQGASWYMLVKTQLALQDVRDRLPEIRAEAIDSMRARATVRNDTVLLRRLANPDTARVLSDTAAALVDKKKLERSRIRQREDWITLTLFFTLASAVDAYVGAHLANFPGTISAEPATGGRTRLRWTLPFTGKPPARFAPVVQPPLRP